jgi:hypothetical protein
MAARARRRRRAPKILPAQGLVGQRGINLIERIVLEMGSRWTPSGPNEIGIDGYIELFDPNSRQPLNLTVAVQSKVVTAIGDGSSPAFDYWCDANDVEYWLNGNTPVILIVSSPDANEGYWISVKEYFKDWTPADSARVNFVKGQHRFDRDSLRLLVAIAAPEQGLYLAPTRHEETLHTNLLLLEGCSARVFIASTDCRTPREIWALLRATKQEVDAGWVLWEKKIFSFHDLSEKPWSAVCEPGTVEGFATAERSESSDSQRQHIFVQLLNQTLKAHLGPEVRYWPQEDCYAIVGRCPKRGLTAGECDSRCRGAGLSRWAIVS